MIKKNPYLKSNPALGTRKAMQLLRDPVRRFDDVLMFFVGVTGAVTVFQ